MRVLHVITTIDAGGAERHLLELAYMQKRSGDEVYIYPLKGKLELLDLFLEIGAHVITVGINRPMFMQYFHLLYLSHRFRFTHIHSHLPRSEILVSLIPNLYAVRLIATKHNAETIFGQSSWNVASVLLARVTELRYANIICISRFVFDFHVANREVGNRKKWSVIYYGLRRHRNLPKNYNNADKATLRIVTISRLVPQKNLFTLIEAASLLKNIGLNFLWHVYGEGPLRDELQSQINTNKLSDVLVLPGKRKDVRSVLLTYDCFVLGSKYEGFGFSILEALDCSLPVIISRTPTSVEIFGEDYAGFFDPNNPKTLCHLLQRFSESEKFLVDLRARSEEVSKRFSLERMYKETLKVYSS